MTPLQFRTLHETLGAAITELERIYIAAVAPREHAGIWIDTAAVKDLRDALITQRILIGTAMLDAETPAGWTQEALV